VRLRREECREEKLECKNESGRAAKSHS
jgi:hypothetical protein